MPSTNKSAKLGILALCTCISSLYFPGAYVIDVVNQHGYFSMPTSQNYTHCSKLTGKVFVEGWSYLSVS